MRDNYHHGNLRQALIDAGIKIINESGEENLSLRKAAAMCNVSHAAPYAHFKDKKELIEAIKASVTEQFMKELSAAVNDSPDAESALINMGRHYIAFFVRRPDYFRFVFGNQNITAHIGFDKKYENDYPPFTLLKETYIRFLREKKLKKSKKEKETELLKLWASAHGIASIACMSGVETSFEWEDRIFSDLLLR
jgi:AcrR family transcriptional regulator